MSSFKTAVLEFDYVVASGKKDVVYAADKHGTIFQLNDLKLERVLYSHPEKSKVKKIVVFNNATGYTLFCIVWYCDGRVVNVYTKNVYNDTRIDHENIYTAKSEKIIDITYGSGKDVAVFVLQSGFLIYNLKLRVFKNNCKLLHNHDGIDSKNCWFLPDKNTLVLFDDIIHRIYVYVINVEAKPSSTCHSISFKYQQVAVHPQLELIMGYKSYEKELDVFDMCFNLKQSLTNFRSAGKNIVFTDTCLISKVDSRTYVIPFADLSKKRLARYNFTREFNNVITTPKWLLVVFNEVTAVLTREAFEPIPIAEEEDVIVLDEKLLRLFQEMKKLDFKEGVFTYRTKTLKVSLDTLIACHRILGSGAKKAYAVQQDDGFIRIIPPPELSDKQISDSITTNLSVVEFSSKVEPIYSEIDNQIYFLKLNHELTKLTII